jgi:hypothetical protein
MATIESPVKPLISKRFVATGGVPEASCTKALAAAPSAAA